MKTGENKLYLEFFFPHRKYAERFYSRIPPGRRGLCGRVETAEPPDLSWEKLVSLSSALHCILVKRGLRESRDRHAYWSVDMVLKREYVDVVLWGSDSYVETSKVVVDVTVNL